MLSSSPPSSGEYWAFPLFRAGQTRSQRPFRARNDDGEDDPLKGTSPPPSPSALRPDAEGLLPNLREVINLLTTPDGLRVFKTAYRKNMLYKIGRYDELNKHADLEVQRQKEIMDLKIPELKELANADESDNWSIFESVSEQYKEAKGRAAGFQQIGARARKRLEGSMGTAAVVRHDEAAKLRDGLVDALRGLANYTSSQPHVVRKVVDIVGSFLKDPALFRHKLMNFMLLGGAGTGKTTLARTIARVFSEAGLFVSGEVIEAGRAELVGQYEGQTVARTRNFLISNLDNGVIFIDEAYAITPWDNGKPEGYGSEAATAMVEFMTQYAGLYCIIVAGYEKEMVRYFLSTNEGLSRRFPNKFVLRDMTPADLVHVFKRKLLEGQGLTVPDGRGVRLESENYFSRSAWDYLEEIISQSLKGEDLIEQDVYDPRTKQTSSRERIFVPNRTFMYRIFENQAGSMANLADEAITVLMSTVTYEDVLRALRNGNERPTFRIQGADVMRDILIQRITGTALSMASSYQAELEAIEEGLGQES